MACGLKAEPCHNVAYGVSFVDKEGADAPSAVAVRARVARVLDFGFEVPAFGAFVDEKLGLRARFYVNPALGVCRGGVNVAVGIARLDHEEGFCNAAIYVCRNALVLLEGKRDDGLARADRLHIAVIVYLYYVVVRGFEGNLVLDVFIVVLCVKNKLVGFADVHFLLLLAAEAD